MQTEQSAGKNIFVIAILIDLCKPVTREMFNFIAVQKIDVGSKFDKKVDDLSFS